MLTGIESTQGTCLRCGKPTTVFLVARYQTMVKRKGGDLVVPAHEVWACEPCFMPAIDDRRNMIHVFP